MRIPRSSRHLLVSLLASTLALPSVAFAQQDHRVAPFNGDGMDTHLFRPAVDSKGFFTVNGSDILGANDISFGLVTDYGHNLMRLESKPDHGTGALIPNSFQGTFHFNYGIANAAVVGLVVPVNMASGDPATNVGAAGQTYDSNKMDSQNVGDIALHAKLRLTRIEKGVGVAIIAQAGFAANEAVQRDLGADKMYYWPQLVVEKRFGSTGAFKLGANVGYRGHTQKNPRFDQLAGGPKFEYANLVTGGLGLAYRVLEPLDLVAETYATQEVGGNSASAVKLSDEVVGGIKVFVERNSYLMLGGGVRTTQGFEAADQRLFIGFIFEPSIGDRDGDGYKDDVDKCPDDPEDFDGFQDEDGCPDEVPDRDHDGIPDAKDKCPDKPENYNGYEDEDGCPDKGPSLVQVTASEIKILDSVNFATDSDKIVGKRSFEVLDGVAAVLSHHPEIFKVEVQGHTDNAGNRDHNVDLSKRRAAAVVTYLTSKGIVADRLGAQGYGPDKPIADNKTAKGRSKNRRVEFQIVQQSGKQGTATAPATK